MYNCGGYYGGPGPQTSNHGYYPNHGYQQQSYVDSKFQQMEKIVNSALAQVHFYQEQARSMARQLEEVKRNDAKREREFEAFKVQTTQKLSSMEKEIKAVTEKTEHLNVVDLEFKEVLDPLRSSAAILQKKIEDEEALKKAAFEREQKEKLRNVRRALFANKQAKEVLEFVHGYLASREFEYENAKPVQMADEESFAAAMKGSSENGESDTAGARSMKSDRSYVEEEKTDLLDPGWAACKALTTNEDRATHSKREWGSSSKEFMARRCRTFFPARAQKHEDLPESETNCDLCDESRIPAAHQFSHVNPLLLLQLSLMEVSKEKEEAIRQIQTDLQKSLMEEFDLRREAIETSVFLSPADKNNALDEDLSRFLRRQNQLYELSNPSYAHRLYREVVPLEKREAVCERALNEAIEDWELHHKETESDLMSIQEFLVLQKYHAVAKKYTSVYNGQCGPSIFPETKT